jgi:transcriptional regulator with XRE-family HTH domain
LGRGAHQSGLDRTYESGIERKVRNPTIEIVERLAKVLKSSASALLD